MNHLSRKPEGAKRENKAIDIKQRRLKYAATINDESLVEATESDYELQYIDIGNVDVGDAFTAQFGITLEHGVLARRQHSIETAQHGERQHHALVLRRAVGSA